jgi:hypothetical protein
MEQLPSCRQTENGLLNNAEIAKKPLPLGALVYR